MFWPLENDTFEGDVIRRVRPILCATCYFDVMERRDSHALPVVQVRDQVRRRRPWVGVLDVRQPSRHTINESMPNAHSSRAAFFSCARSSMRISKRRPVALAGKMENWKTWTRPNTVTKRPFSRRVSTGGRRLQTQRSLLELMLNPFLHICRE